MGGPDGIFLCISMSYKILLFFGQTPENRKNFYKCKCRGTLFQTEVIIRKCIRKGRHETCFVSKVINSEWILWMESGLDHILKHWRVLFLFLFCSLIVSGDFHQRCVLGKSIFKWNSKGWNRAEENTGVGRPIIDTLPESKWEVQKSWFRRVTMGKEKRKKGHTGKQKIE